MYSYVITSLITSHTITNLPSVGLDVTAGRIQRGRNVPVQSPSPDDLETGSAVDSNHLSSTAGDHLSSARAAFPWCELPVNMYTA